MAISKIGSDALAAGATTPTALSTGAPSWDLSGNLSFNSGYGSAATAYGCRAWVNFNGTGTVAIRASGNVSSITDNGTADYTVNFTSAMPDANYCAQATTASSNLGGGACAAMMNTQAAMATSSVRILLSNFTTGPDQAYVGVSVFR